MPMQVSEEDFLAAVHEHGPSTKAIAEAIGISQRATQSRLRRLINRGKVNADKTLPGFTPGAGRVITRVSTQRDSEGEIKSYSVVEKPETPEEEFKPELAMPARVSTLRDRSGAIVQQWSITKPEDRDIFKAVQAAADGLKEGLEPFEPIKSPNLLFFPDLVNLYVLSDAHIGGLTWHGETGEDWDLKIAEETLTKAFEQMINQSPQSSTAIVALLGDWMHYDKLEAVTTISGNVLDSDGRRGKMIKVAVRVARRVIAKALEHHSEVDLLIAEGNHDLIGAAWLRELFVVAYENEPRVRIIEDERPYYGIQHGNVFIGFHHGHLKGLGKKNQPNSGEQLALIFSDEYGKIYGPSEKRYIHTGHLHFATEGEVRGARIMQHPTIATRDGHQMRSGYGSLREIRGITYHKRFGQTGMVNISPEMVRG